MSSNWIFTHLEPQQRYQAATDLRNAADYISTYGWTQGRDEDEKGQVCIAGALSRIDICTDSDTCTGLDCRHTLAQAAFGKYAGKIAVVWNDEPGRTQLEVLTTLRSCATWLDELATKP